MAQLITEMVGREPYKYYPLGKYVARAPGVCGGRPTFKYTRIEITGALERLAAGETIDEIVSGYRGKVSREAIIEAIQLIATQFLQTLPQLEPAWWLFSTNNCSVVTLKNKLLTGIREQSVSLQICAPIR